MDSAAGCVMLHALIRLYHESSTCSQVRALYFGRRSWQRFLKECSSCHGRPVFVTQFLDVTVHEWEDLSPDSVFIEYVGGHGRLVTLKEGSKA